MVFVLSLGCGGFIGDCAFVSRLSLRICFVRCLALVREPLDGGFAASVALAFFFRAKIPKKGFSIEQYRYAEFTDIPMEVRTKDRGIVAMPSLLASPEEKRAHQLRRFESWL